MAAVGMAPGLRDAAGSRDLVSVWPGRRMLHYMRSCQRLASGARDGILLINHRSWQLRNLTDPGSGRLCISAAASPVRGLLMQDTTFLWMMRDPAEGR